MDQFGKFFLLLTAAVILFGGFASTGADPGDTNGGTRADESTNVHYSGKYCSECHERIPVKGGASFLKYDGDFHMLCKCHGYKPGTYIHPVDIVPSVEKQAVIPDELPLKDGKLSCMTCHDIYLQCRENTEARFSNKRFLRGAPFQKRTDLCFKCHDNDRYSKHNPHTHQLGPDGEINVKQCLYCHVRKPDELRESFDDVQLVGDLLIVCQRCHMKSAKHPADAKHIVVPSSGVLSKMRTTEKQFNIVLPLDYNGKIFCGTCHNPHQRGVIPSENVGSRGAIETYGQRFLGKMCIACHKR